MTVPTRRFVPLQAAEDVTTGVASAQSTAAPSGTYWARIVTTVACRYLVGANPTALATSAYLPPNVVEYVPVEATQKIAAIQEAAAGKLSITFGYFYAAGQ